MHMFTRLFNPLSTRHLRGDIYGGLTAAVIALPLALAFGVASGAGPVAGLWGAIMVGFFAAWCGGTPVQISGPTGPMTVVMATVVAQFSHNPALAFTVVMLGGLLQVALGLFRLGRYVNLMPYPVISGFMSGIGVIIILLQLPPLLGYPGAGSPLAALMSLPAEILEPYWPSVAMGAATLVIVFFTPKRIGHIVPSPLIALFLGTFAAWHFELPLNAIGEIPTGLPRFVVPAFETVVLQDMLIAAVILALLGSMDSLLTSLVADNVTQTTHDSDRELVGQGIGNFLAGLVGGIPGAGATMRTMANVRAGGRTPLSGMVHALVLLAMVLGLGGIASHIPHSVLAGILFKVGIDIIDWNYLRRVLRAPKAGVLMMAVVLLLTVFVDLITAVAVGTIMASLLFVKRMADLQLANILVHDGSADDGRLPADERELLRRGGGRVQLIRLSGPMSFGAASGMSRILNAVKTCRALVLDLSEVPFVDSSASIALENAIRRARENGARVYLAGLAPPVANTLARLGVLALVADSHRYRTRGEALAAAADSVSATM